MLHLFTLCFQRQLESLFTASCQRLCVIHLQGFNFHVSDDSQIYPFILDLSHSVQTSSFFLTFIIETLLSLFKTLVTSILFQAHHSDHSSLPSSLISFH
uniref:Uncharacterized protein n=1 Tax=Gopherus agassizii TaxID=38772 RepID=A0A452GXY4_9SAUR